MNDESTPEAAKGLGPPTIFAVRAAFGFVGVAQCECGVQYMHAVRESLDAACEAVAKLAEDDGWDVRPTVICPWCLESAGLWPDERTRGDVP